MADGSETPKSTAAVSSTAEVEELTVAGCLKQMQTVLQLYEREKTVLVRYLSIYPSSYLDTQC